MAGATDYRAVRNIKRRVRFDGDIRELKIESCIDTEYDLGVRGDNQGAGTTVAIDTQLPVRAVHSILSGRTLRSGITCFTFWPGWPLWSLRTGNLLLRRHVTGECFAASQRTGPHKECCDNAVKPSLTIHTNRPFQVVPHAVGLSARRPHGIFLSG